MGARRPSSVAAQEGSRLSSSAALGCPLHDGSLLGGRGVSRTKFVRIRAGIPGRAAPADGEQARVGGVRRTPDDLPVPIQEHDRDGEGHPERVDRAAPGEQQRVIGCQPTSVAEPAHPLAAADRDVHEPPPATGIDEGLRSHARNRSRGRRHGGWWGVGPRVAVLGGALKRDSNHGSLMRGFRRDREGRCLLQEGLRPHREVGRPTLNRSRLAYLSEFSGWASVLGHPHVVHRIRITGPR